MSAPDTNTEKKKDAHKTPIAGMTGVVIFAVVLLLGLFIWLSYWGNDPGTAGNPDGGVSVDLNETGTVDGGVEVEIEGTDVQEPNTVTE